MTKDEALRLALEALESTGENDGYHGLTQYFDEKMVDKAITAIKAALEAKDEPVAQPKVRTGNCLRVGVCASEGHKIQPQRTWVGLSDKLKVILVKNAPNWTAIQLIEETELLLKEKNI